MNQPSKIYVVTDGDYSDYHIEAVFDDKEKAKSYALNINGREPEEYDLNPVWDGPKIPEGYIPFEIHMDRDGLGIADQEWVRYVPGGEIYFTNKSYTDPEIVMCIRLWAKDREHAIKIANDKRSEIIALKGWPEQLFNIDYKGKKTYLNYIDMSLEDYLA